MRGRGQREIRIWFGPEEEAVARHKYRIAGVDVCSNRSIQELSPFAGPEENRSWSQGPRMVGARAPAVAYGGRGFVGGREVEITCTTVSGRYDLCIDHTLELSLDAEPDTWALRVNAEASDLRARLAVLGPGLALALALGDTFSLHASAVTIGSRLLVISGDSGAGKSTLASRARAAGIAARVADDTVPVGAFAEDGLLALPRFPQLKLGSEEQWVGSEEVPVDEILFLERRPGALEPARKTLSDRDAVLRLVENTVASRLFGPDLSSRHLDACIHCLGATRVSDLWIPDGLHHLDRVLEFLVSS